MTTGTPLPAFEHDPLPEYTSHFRLLHIIRGDFEQRVECEISAWPIDNAPRYYAISYTWGDPADATEITVNGRSLVVRRNCEYVLQQAFATRKSGYFWVDAICIAQTTEEKNHQVGIMGQIYSGAEHVLACVGPHENDSQFLSQTIREYRSLLMSIYVIGIGNLWSTPGHKSFVTNTIILFRCLLAMKPRTRKRLYASFCSFMRRPYFKRLWIIQELHLARRVSFCFGGAVEAAEDFLALYDLLDIWIKDPFYCSPSKLVKRLSDLIRFTMACFRTKASLAMQSTFTGLGTSPSLLYFACTSRKQVVQHLLLDTKLQCSDPRDRLFGLLSLVDRLPKDGTKPDYTKDLFEVAVEALRVINMASPFDVNLRAKSLCRSFQVTGEEASLRNALALRSCTSRLKTIPDHLHHNRLVRSDYEWKGIRISRDAKDSRLSVPIFSGDLSMCVSSAQEHEGYRSLHLVEEPKVFSILAPRDTRSGDWCLFRYSSVKGEIPLSLVVRISEGGKYHVIGQTVHVESDYTRLLAVCLGDGSMGFTGFWYPEDALVWGWVLSELESHDVTQERIREYVNRRVCAWDGSSYFLKGRRQPDLNRLVVSSDSSIPPSV